MARPAGGAVEQFGNRKPVVGDELVQFRVVETGDLPVAVCRDDDHLIGALPDMVRHLHRGLLVINRYEKE
ncbi:hypothetical protein P8631_09590 [Guyparkeria sp. 1SP6A2]|nr:hypothetical protein [Guyparkeria sp. 1SP6A2]